MRKYPPLVLAAMVLGVTVVALASASQSATTEIVRTSRGSTASTSLPSAIARS